MDILAIIKSVLSLASLILTMVRDRQQRGIGRMEAVNEALETAHRDIAYANAIEEEARRLHDANPDSDAGFHPDYWRD